MQEKIEFLKNKKIMVLGLGKTGISVIKKIYGVCPGLIAVDENKNISFHEDFKDFLQNNHEKIEIILGKYSGDFLKLFKNIELVITSPGIPCENQIIRKAEELGIPIWSELELAWNLLDESDRKNTIAVTGTNGKTTTVNLIGKIFKDNGFECIVCGNVGLPLIDTVSVNLSNPVSKNAVIRIIEVSSFQLERSNSFNPGVAILLNITSDHIDRHKSMEEYADFKFIIFKNQKEKDFAVLNTDDRLIKKNFKEKEALYFKGNNKPQIVKISTKNPFVPGTFHKSGKIFFNIKGKTGEISLKNIHLEGSHNIYNIMASAVAGLIFEVDVKGIQESIKSFKPLAHRMEFIAEVEGIKCFNDSKSTNPDAVAAALSGFKKRVTLIMGGKDKGMDFGCLLSSIKKKTSVIILIGESKHKLNSFLKEHINVSNKPGIYICNDFEEAVNLGFRLTERGGVLLLSPGCASMDMFTDYKHRGNTFRDLVLSRIKKDG